MNIRITNHGSMPIDEIFQPYKYGVEYYDFFAKSYKAVNKDLFMLAVIKYGMEFVEIKC